MEQHQTYQMGTFIAELRKERQMTQKELAAKLGVTDKAVSKWERSLSCPDIALLMPLAEALGVTVSELLSGRQQASEAEERAAQSALRYSQQTLLERLGQAKQAMLAILTGVFLLSAGICVLCDFLLTGGMSWSWIVLLSLAFAWAAVRPLFLGGEGTLRKLLLAVSAGILPYLAGLSLALRRPAVFQLGACIALLSVGWAWGIFWLLVKKAPRRRWRKLQMTAAVCLLTVPLSWAIRAVAAWMLWEPVGAALADGAVNTLSAVLAAAGFFLWDMLAARRGERGRDRCAPCGRGAGDGEDA